MRWNASSSKSTRASLCGWTLSSWKTSTTVCHLTSCGLRVLAFAHSACGAGFSNGVLWPLFHYIDTIKFNAGLYEAYVKANELFAQAVTSIWQEGDMIWIHECAALTFLLLACSQSECGSPLTRTFSAVIT